VWLRAGPICTVDPSSSLSELMWHYLAVSKTYHNASGAWLEKLTISSLLLSVFTSNSKSVVEAQEELVELGWVAG
jgi:hypothetical protein